MYEKNFKSSVENMQDVIIKGRQTNSIALNDLHFKEAQVHATIAIATAIMHFTEQIKELRGAIEEVSDTLSRELSK